MGAADPSMFTKQEIRALLAGHAVDVNGRRYSLCPDCEQAIRVDGWFGSLHLCVPRHQRQRRQ